MDLILDWTGLDPFIFSQPPLFLIDYWAKLQNRHKTTSLKIVKYDKETAPQWAQIAKEYGYDFLMGMISFDSIIFAKNNQKKLKES